MWKPIKIYRTSGPKDHIELDAQFQVLQDAWPFNNDIPRTEWPSLACLPNVRPGVDRWLVLGVARRWGWENTESNTLFLSYSDDQGTTWAPSAFLRPFLTSLKVLSNLGEDGICLEPTGVLWRRSQDHGVTWTGTMIRELSSRDAVDRPDTGAHWGAFATPILVDRDAQGRKRLLVTTSKATTREWGNVHGIPRAILWASTDGGKTWSELLEKPRFFLDLDPPAYDVALARSAGTLIAALRTARPLRIAELPNPTETIPQDMPGFINIDAWDGLAVATSQDDGRIFSKVTRLFDYGRHYASMVVLPGTDTVVLTYAVTMDGYNHLRLPAHRLRGKVFDFQRFGVEAVVSHDHGATWDLDHRYLLAVWPGQTPGPAYPAYVGGVRGVSSAVLPNGDILTLYGTGHRREPYPLPESDEIMRLLPDDQKLIRWRPPRTHYDFALIRWRLSDRPVSDNTTIRRAPIDSPLRNRLDVSFIPSRDPL